MPAYMFVASVEFDQLHTEQERRDWLADMRDYCHVLAEGEEPVDEEMLIELDGALGSLLVDFDPSQNASLRRDRMHLIADRIEGCRLGHPVPLPDVWPFKHRL